MGGEEATQSGFVEEEVDLDRSFLTGTNGGELESSGPGDPVPAGDGGVTEGGEPQERRVQLGRLDLDVCLGPLEESRVRISLEEAERYSKFCRRCRWLCGKMPLGL